MTKLEGALRPREAVLAWLVEAQQSPGFIDHARSIAELPVEAAPLSIIGRRIDAAVREDMKGQPRDAVEAAVRRAFGDAMFLLSLVLVINIDALEIAKVEGLRAAAVFFWMGTLLGGPRGEELSPEEREAHTTELASCWAQWRAVVDLLERDVRVEAEARTALGQQFFGGHDVLLMDAAASWGGHADQVNRLTMIAAAMSIDNHEAPSGPEDGPLADGAFQARVADRAARLADDARIRAYEALGERSRAVAIMERRILRDGTPGVQTR